MSRLGFKLQAVASGSQARAARFRTLHGDSQGDVLTPLFMPVGTNATVRAQRLKTLEDVGTQILLANTYHLLLRPGAEVFRQAGGIHGFMNWKRSVLTDSGGYQIFSLPNGRELTEEGAAFRSYIDGEKILLSPERSIQTQIAIGSDIMMALDQCVSSTCSRSEAAEAMDRTHRWAERSLKARGESSQSLFAIVQGACFADLRKLSAAALTSMPFDGFAIGGLAVGETRAEREETTAITAEALPRDLPRYLMGVGTPIDLLEGVHRGVDMFDCILPTAYAQQGMAYTSRGRVDLRRGAHRFSRDPLDPACSCETCANHTRAYLHHLIKAREVIGWQLVGAHNLEFYHSLMRRVREAIVADTFLDFYREQREVLVLDDGAIPRARPSARAARRLTLGNYELHRVSSGHFSIRQIGSGEVMHSVSEPRAEARKLYIDQSGLAGRLRSDGPPLVLWDVGLGAATNAMEAIHCYEREASEKGAGSGELRALRIVSFENDLDSLRLAVKCNAFFPGLWHPAPARLLREGAWRSADGRIEWVLLEGDFRQRLGEAPLPELVYYDPFSYKADASLWTPTCFRDIRERLAESPAALFTYSASTRVRAALLSAGFLVARGAETGPKSETTVAFTPAWLRTESRRWEFLDGCWLERWERSGARIPPSVGPEEHAAFEGAIRSHPQFDARFQASLWQTPDPSLLTLTVT